MKEFFPPRRETMGLLLVLVAGCAVPDSPAPAVDAPPTLPAPTALPSPAAPGSAEPNLYVAADDRVHMSWIEPAGSGHELRFATLAGDQWSEPQTIAAGEAFFVNWADFPSLIELENGTLAAHWLQKKARVDSPYAYDVVVSFSSDGGNRWTPGLSPHRDGVAAEHGFVSMLPDRNDGLVAVWLDGRNAAAAVGEHDRPTSTPDMTLRTAHLTASGAISDEMVLDGRTCDCCQTAAARIGDTLLVAYRDRSDDEVRDIYTVRRDSEGWHEPVLVAPDGWMIPGCPVNGPAIAVRGDRAAVAWFTLGNGVPEVKLAFTDDAGRSFTEPILVAAPDGDWAPLGRVDAEWADEDNVLVTWLAANNEQGEIRYRTRSRHGESGDLTVLGLTSPSRSSGFPRMIRAGSRLVFAWTLPGEPGEIKVAAIELDGHP